MYLHASWHKGIFICEYDWILIYLKQKDHRAQLQMVGPYFLSLPKFTIVFLKENEFTTVSSITKNSPVNLLLMKTRVVMSPWFQTLANNLGKTAENG